MRCAIMRTGEKEGALPQTVAYELISKVLAIYSTLYDTEQRTYSIHNGDLG